MHVHIWARAQHVLFSNPRTAPTRGFDNLERWDTPPTLTRPTLTLTLTLTLNLTLTARRT